MRTFLVFGETIGEDVSGLNEDVSLQSCKVAILFADTLQSLLHHVGLLF